MTYKASLDKLAKIITIGTTILFLVIIGKVLFTATAERFILQAFVALLLIFIYIVCYAFRPINYLVTADNVIIHRLFKDIIIDRNSITNVAIIEKENMSKTFRTYGVGGLFGYFGNFYNSKIGNMSWYASQKNNYILLYTKLNQKIIITPDEAQKFITDFKVQ